MKRAISAILILMLITASLVACTPNLQISEKTLDFFSMNTAVTMTAYGENAEASLVKARTRTLELENKWSVTIDTSEIYAINHANGSSVEVSGDTLGLIDFSLELAKKTGGAFDPTIYPVVSLWGFTNREFYVPSDEEIATALQFVDYGKISVSGNAVTLPEGMSLDFGAVGKGYALDEVLSILKADGIISALVNFGGNIGMIGDKIEGGNWQIGVRDPQGTGELGVLSLADCAVATSGNYQRYFEDQAGNRYGHIINPATGRPQESELLSVTVVAKNGKLCDALATAIYVMGKDAAIELWRKENSFELLLITDDGTAYVTEELFDAFQSVKVGLTVQKITR